MEEDWNIVLSVLESPDRSSIGRQKVFTQSPIVIGRSEEADFIVTDPSVSRNHATLRITNDYSRVFITDTSTHGTMVSGKPVPKGLGSGFTVHSGDDIQVGGSTIKFELNLKQSVQSTFVGKIDRSFLDTPPERPAPPINDAGEDSIAAPPEKKAGGANFLYIGIIVVCILVLVYLMFFQ